MINATDRPLLLIQGDQLHAGIVQAIDVAIDMLKPLLDSHKRARQHDFYEVFGTHQRKPDVQLDEAFIQRCFDVSQTDSKRFLDKKERDSLSQYVSINLPASAVKALRRGLKLMFVELWHSGHLLLPTTFKVGSQFPIYQFKSRLVEWLEDFSLEDPTGNRFRRYGHKLLWASDWRTPSDISLTDLAELHHAYFLYSRQQSSTVISSSPIPFTLFPAKALEQFPDEVTFTVDDLRVYSKWSLIHSYHGQSFDDYRSKPWLSRRQKKAEQNPLPKAARIKRKSPEPRDPPTESDAFEALRLNFVRLSKGPRGAADWGIHDVPSYNGREHVVLHPVARSWVDAMRAYMHHRTHVKGYRTHGAATAALNLLADYLFFYLPWWQEIATSPKVDLPCSPREFSRFSFVSRHTAESRDNFPETLLNAIGWRRTSKDAIAIMVHQIALFFSFVEIHFSDNEDVAGSKFRSPLNPDFDSPRSKARTKTTKEIIPKNIYSYLLFYIYAIEDVGMQLERLALAGKLPTTKKALSQALWLKLDDFGIKTAVRHRSIEYPLDAVPNVFQWAMRTPRASGAATLVPAFVPHCTVLRLLQTSVETGLRCQSVQWLDRRTWKKEASTVSADAYTFPLYVNTDKTKTQPWVTYVVHRVRDMLYRQEAFQAQFEDADAYESIPYEGTPDSPFDYIEPLFRAPSGAKPVSDNVYYKYWLSLMVGFESFYRVATGEEHVQLCKLQPILEPDGTPVVRQTANTASALYCPMSLRAVHTPHACRATFATNRKGILELADTAQLLGHSSEVVTAHYDKPSFEDLQQRLKQSDLVMSRDFVQFEAESDVHVRADKPDSALIRSFSKDRAATLKTFGFMPSVTLWSSEDSVHADGLQLLQDGPMSRIRFRETHICPVGEECPTDIIERIGAPKRCGCCPLAMRCVDHQPAIAAKRNQLLERIRYIHARFRILQTQGEPTTVLDELWGELELDVNEYLGWQLSEEILNSMPRAAHGDEQMHVEQPEVVKRHLQRVSRSCGTAELMLQRIADSNAYPSLSSPHIQLVASQVKRRLLAGAGHDAISWSEGDDASSIKDVAAMLSTMMKATGVSREQVANALSASNTDITVRMLEGGAHGE